MRFKKLAVFDFDSTLLAGESINLVLNEILSDSKDKENLETIRAQGMRGEIDLESSLNQRITFFKGLKLERLQQICQTMPWTIGAKETIAVLKKQGYLSVCISAGFRTATRRVITELNLDGYCCNTLKHHDGVLTGDISGSLMNHKSKGVLLKRIQGELQISPENTLVVGDGANDLSMFQHAKTKVAFCADESLIKQSNFTINEKNLSLLLDKLD